MERDLVISNALEAIEKMKKELINVPEENYKFKTNCRFGDKNIKTLSLKDLIECLRLVDAYRYGLHRVYVTDSITFKNELENNEYDMHGFSCGDWQCDIMYLIKKIKYNEQLRNLEEKSKALEGYYSKEKQDDIAVQNLLNSLGL